MTCNNCHKQAPFDKFHRWWISCEDFTEYCESCMETMSDASFEAVVKKASPFQDDFIYELREFRAEKPKTEWIDFNLNEGV
jgi:hypothetical protein